MLASPWFVAGANGTPPFDDANKTVPD